MASVNQGPSICLDGQVKIDPAQGVIGIPSSAHGSYAPIYFPSTRDDRGVTVSLDGQTKIDPAQGVNIPSSAHGSYSPIYSISIRDDRGSTAQPKDPAALPFTVPTPLLGATVYYSMRRTDTGAVGGYAHWVNTTGTTAGAPAAIGSVGAPQILAIYN